MKKIKTGSKYTYSVYKIPHQLFYHPTSRKCLGVKSVISNDINMGHNNTFSNIICDVSNCQFSMWLVTIIKARSPHFLI